MDYWIDLLAALDKTVVFKYAGIKIPYRVFRKLSATINFVRNLTREREVNRRLSRRVCVHGLLCMYLLSSDDAHPTWSIVHIGHHTYPYGY